MLSLKKILRKLSMTNVGYQPLIEVRIFKDALLHNLNEFKKHHPGLQFAPVIKSNAYGHGMVQVAEVLDKEDKAFFMVDSFYEALVLRRAGIKSKILMLGFNRVEQLVNPKLKDCSATIIDFSTLREVIKKLKKPMFYHLKIDTGMHRQGLWGEEIEQAVALIKSNPNFVLEGLCSHLADADGESEAYTKKQIELWNQTVELYKKSFPYIKYFHLAATAGTRYSQNIKANVARVGIGLYGINPAPSVKMDLRPALEMVSVVSSVRTIPAGKKSATI